jgi:hypothetical protein
MDELSVVLAPSFGGVVCGVVCWAGWGASPVNNSRLNASTSSVLFVPEVAPGPCGGSIDPVAGS